MTDNNILIGAQRQAELEAAKADFFASGGSISLVEGCSFSPPPTRSHPQPVKKPPVTVRPPEPVRVTRSARDEKIAAMAETMTCRQAAEVLGIAPKALYCIARRISVKFVTNQPGRKARDPAEFTSIAEQIEAMSKIGVSKVRAARHLGITPRFLAQIATEFGIKFDTDRRTE